MAPPIIDAHQHFWDPAGDYDYPWLAGDFLPIRRSFEPSDLRPGLERVGVAGTVLVQTQNSLNETRDFLVLAARTDFVRGVIGWVDLTDPSVGTLLAELKSSSSDVGWSACGISCTRSRIHSGCCATTCAVVGKTVHLPAMLRTVADFPQLRFVLDHIAKPEIKEHGSEPWISLMSEFTSHRGHVWCKQSGMITEADWSAWTPDDLRPYVTHALSVFGTERCMYGSDWPVCLVAGSYDRVIGALRSCLADRTAAEGDQIFGRSAFEAYHLPADDASAKR